MADTTTTTLARVRELEQQAAELRDVLQGILDGMLSEDDAAAETDWTRVDLIAGLESVIMTLEQMPGSALALRTLGE